LNDIYKLKSWKTFDRMASVEMMIFTIVIWECYQRIIYFIWWIDLI
jgi:hypothetical protein